MKDSGPMATALKRAAAGMSAGGEGGAEKPEPAKADDEKRAKREELTTAVMEFKQAETPEEATDAFIAAMELCRDYEA